MKFLGKMDFRAPRQARTLVRAHAPASSNRYRRNSDRRIPAQLLPPQFLQIDRDSEQQINDQ
jgi:hypothetical protein